MTTPAAIATAKWIQRFIIGENICPFAAPSVLGKRLLTEVSEEQGLAEALEQLSMLAERLDKETKIETALLVFSDGFKDFNDFLDLIELADQLIDDLDYRGTYQLAHFHPDYIFEGEAPESTSHFTNRSPYPTLHLIRETSLKRVLKGSDDSSDIVEANIERVGEIGFKRLAEMLAEDLAAK